MRYINKIISLPRYNNLQLSFLGSKKYSDNLNRSHCNEAGAAEVAPAQNATAPLVDSFGRRHNYLRISLTERCNLRCQYCMPAEGVPLSARSALLSRAELARLARVFVAAGVDKVRLTGGEPTLRADLADVIRELREAGVRSVSITTNGLVLTRRLPALQRAGLAAINVSLDSLRPDRYERMARRPGLARVLAGVDLALQLGYSPVKINVVLMRGFNDDEICDFVEYTRDRDVEVRFIEFMPFSGNKWDDSKLVPYREALRAVFQRHPQVQPAPPRDNDTARVWRVPGYAGSVGFISSMTQHFCSTCNRLRLTADGNLKVCLFGAAEVSLRDRLRAGASDADLTALLRAALRNKKARHAARRSAPSERAAAAPPPPPPRPLAPPLSAGSGGAAPAPRRARLQQARRASRRRRRRRRRLLAPGRAGARAHGGRGRQARDRARGRGRVPAAGGRAPAAAAARRPPAQGRRAHRGGGGGRYGCQAHGLTDPAVPPAGAGLGARARAAAGGRGRGGGRAARALRGARHSPHGRGDGGADGRRRGRADALRHVQVRGPRHAHHGPARAA
ncbi:unnamed protein product [Chrysodeixis includens]|uniref:GTP 3',8-cyclase n=1 Tax=Chrysodeixis includens TaxID=689277 RepID=A0A9P0FSV4_CHRIL|nr:unnamed protein product [Chrysodeixis includens]